MVNITSNLNQCDRMRSVKRERGSRFVSIAAQ